MFYSKQILSLLVLVAFCALTPPAYAVEATVLSVIRPNDTGLSCNQLSTEAMLMSDIINTSHDIQDHIDLQKHGITALGALGSFVAGTATGGVGFAAAGYLLKETAGEPAEKAEEIENLALQRRAMLIGIFTARHCYGPIEHVLAPPQNDAEAIQMADIKPAAGEDTGYNN